jgi:hypothetical protein
MNNIREMSTMKPPVLELVFDSSSDNNLMTPKFENTAYRAQ